MEDAQNIYVVGSGNMAHMHCLAINSFQGFNSCNKFLIVHDKIFFTPPQNFVVKKFENLFIEKMHDIFLLIIASGSIYQPQILNTFLQHTKIHHYLLEKNLASNISELKSLMQVQNSCFINFPLHFHDEIQFLELFFDKTIEINVFSKNHILMTNSIHYMNLAKRIFGSEPTELVFLPKSKLLPTKRPYAKDFYGDLLVSYSADRKLRISSSPDLNEELTINLKTSTNGTFYVDIDKGTVSNNNELVSFTPFKYSLLGGRIYQSILNSSSPYLRLDYSLNLQLQILEELGSLYFGNEFNSNTKIPLA